MRGIHKSAHGKSRGKAVLVVWTLNAAVLLLIGLVAFGLVAQWAPPSYTKEVSAAGGPSVTIISPANGSTYTTQDNIPVRVQITFTSENRPQCDSFKISKEGSGEQQVLEHDKWVGGQSPDKSSLYNCPPL
jgi:hypothetical protein